MTKKSMKETACLFLMACLAVSCDNHSQKGNDSQSECHDTSAQLVERDVVKSIMMSKDGEDLYFMTFEYDQDGRLVNDSTYCYETDVHYCDKSVSYYEDGDNQIVELESASSFQLVFNKDSQPIEYKMFGEEGWDDWGVADLTLDDGKVTGWKFRENAWYPMTIEWQDGNMMKSVEYLDPMGDESTYFMYEYTYGEETDRFNIEVMECIQPESDDYNGELNIRSFCDALRSKNLPATMRYTYCFEGEISSQVDCSFEYMKDEEGRVAEIVVNGNVKYTIGY